MGVYDRILRPLLFRLDAETAHHVGMRAIAAGLVRAHKYTNPSLAVEALGLRFENPIGLAAGFDKNAVALRHWPALGFGFIEVGTITPRPQPGNPKPRMFRLPADRAIINRLGFNNEGAEAIAVRLKNRPPGFPVGINLGKNKDTPPEEAAQDYATSFAKLRTLGDYFVVNVSSPNTPGLRALQEKGPLREIFAAIRSVQHDTKLLVKIAPDLEESGVHDVMEVAHEFSLAGVIATNTTLSRDGLTTPSQEAGGLSGRPLAQKSNDILRQVVGLASPDMTIIGVGGIFNAEDVQRKLDLGAKLVQMYTGWVYGGPNTVPHILRTLKSHRI